MGRDIVYALRRLRRAPGFTAVAVAVMALGIGVNTAIFSVVNATLLAPLPYRRPRQLVALYETLPGVRALSGPDFHDWQRQATLFQGMSLLQYSSGFNLNAGGQPVRVRGARAEANFFSLLGVKAALGTAFASRGDARGAVVLSYGLWRSQFGGNAGVVGQRVDLNGRPYVIAGVLPVSFHWQPQPQVWVALNMNALGPRGYYDYRAVARLRPGVTLAAAQAQLAGIAARLARQYPVSNRGVGAVMVPLRSGFVALPLRVSLWTLLAVVGLVLLIACADVANLLLARAAGRRQEIAVRRALGASGPRIATQLLSEAMLLAAAGAVAGGLCAWAALRLVGGLPGLGLPATAVVGMDMRVLAFTAAVALASGVLFGLAPVWQLRLSNLRIEAGSGAAARRGWLSDGLVVAQVALALVLVVMSGLLLESLQRMRARPLGLNPNQLLSMEVSFGTPPNFRAWQTVQNEFLGRLSALPGIETASLANELPVAGGIEDHSGYPVLAGQNSPSRIMIDDARVSANYLETTQLPLLAGSWYSPAQVRDWRQAAVWKWAAAPSPRRTAALARFDFYVVVNEAFARQFIPGGALGQRFRDDKYSHWMTIEGVVGNVPVRGPGQSAMPTAYYPVFSGPYLLVRSRMPAAAVVADVRRAQAGLGIEAPVWNVRTISEVMDGASGGAAWQGGLTSAFAALALLLAGAGIYGVMALRVAARRREIGVRMALGAGGAAVAAAVLRRALGLALAGIVAGAACALLAGHGLAAQLYQTSPVNPGLLGLAAAVLLTATLVASYVPARRATRTDPAEVLRAE